MEVALTHNSYSQRNVIAAQIIETKAHPRRITAAANGNWCGDAKLWRKPSDRAAVGNRLSRGLAPAGNFVSGTKIPPPANSSKNRRLATARVASARNVPAMSSPSPENEAVPKANSTMAGAIPPVGDHPIKRPINAMRSNCMTSIEATAKVLATIKPDRDRGLADSRFNTPERRSNPVAIPCPVKAVDRTATVITPGTR